MKLYKPLEAAPLMYNVKSGKLGLSASRVRKLCQDGRIGRKVGAGYIISQQEIDKFNQLDRPKGRPKN